MPDAEERTVHPAWRLDEPQPTDLILYWHDETAPTLVEVQSILGASLGREVEVIDHLDAPPGEVVWNGVVQLSDEYAPAIVWSEPARPVQPDDAAKLGIEHARWVIGVQTILNPFDPLANYAWLLRLLAGAFDDSPAVLDVASGRWFRRSDLEEAFLNAPAPPAAEMLWIIHAVSADGGGEDAPTWLHTHGLNRCARPELEMLEVPRGLVGAAGHLINDVAELILEEMLPAPGEPLGVARDAAVTLHPWREAVKYLAEGAPGSLRDRSEPELDPDHSGVSAVICGEKPRGILKKVWTWPRDLVERLNRDEAMIFRTKRATERTATLAQATWPEMAMAFASLKSSGIATSGEHRAAIFLIKAGFGGRRDDGAEDREAREHLWFQLTQVEGDRAFGELINTPQYVDYLNRGESVWIDRDRISDWCVMSEAGRFEPGRRAGLRAAIDDLRRNRR